MDTHPARTFGPLTVEIDRTLCIGSGNCVNVAPGVFRLDDQNLATFTDDPAPASDEQLIEACTLCPVAALIMTDEDGEQIVP